jgi:hypothetical protein
MDNVTMPFSPLLGNSAWEGMFARMLLLLEERMANTWLDQFCVL